ncbi:MAG: DUF5320 domain-containing protein [Coriobacteriia bacterium]|nr:DUF5320 domain-containing protein [Coriobacteriia bacterium]
MPRGDATGPMGLGPMTGRGGGYCIGGAPAGQDYPVAGRGLGLGRGRGLGRRFASAGSTAQSDPASVRQALKNRVGFLQAEIDEINKRLADTDPDGTSD